MSQIGGTIGGKIGNSQNPFFTSPGGITPQQAGLASYDYGQSLLDELAQFAGSDQGGGISDSTMATQAAGGANVGKALEEAKLSDTLQNAEFGAYQTGTNIQSTNQTNALNEISNLSKLTGGTGTSGASGAGTAAGLAAPLPTE